MMQKDNNTKNISRKLAGYSALAGAFMLAGGQANADVVYTDLSPGVLVDGSAFDIDFDGDGTIDATVLQTGSIFATTYTTTYGSTFMYGSGYEVVGVDAKSNQFVGYGSPSAFVYASALASGVLVGATGTAVPNITNSLAGFGFATMLYSTYYSGPAFGQWFPGTDAYIGMEFTAGSGAVHNAWIRVEVIDGTQALVLGYAFDDTPGAAILTGDEGAACDATTAPANFAATVSGSTVTFTWDAVAGSEGCQLVAGPAGGGFPITRNFVGTGVNTSGPIPLAIIPPGTYQAKTRCACSITPVIATPFSNTDQFTVPAPKMGAELTGNISPNPATNQLGLTYEATADEEVTFRISNLAGQELFAQTSMMFAGKQNVTFDVSDFNSGMYILQIVNGENAISEQFEVIK